MKKVTTFILMVAVTILLIRCSSDCKEAKTSEEKPKLKVKTDEQRVEEGRLLVEKMGCNDCHSKKVMTEMGPVPDESMLMAGHPADEVLAPYDNQLLQSYVLMNMSLTATVGPWGITYAANLTPDPTGIGTWTIDNFKKAIREGKYKGMDNTRMLLPPMPWQGYAKMTDDELESIFAYLKSLPPVKNIVPEAVINLPPQ